MRELAPFCAQRLARYRAYVACGDDGHLCYPALQLRTNAGSGWTSCHDHFAALRQLLIRNKTVTLDDSAENVCVFVPTAGYCQKRRLYPMLRSRIDLLPPASALFRLTVSGSLPTGGMRLHHRCCERARHCNGAQARW